MSRSVDQLLDVHNRYAEEDVRRYAVDHVRAENAKEKAKLSGRPAR